MSNHIHNEFLGIKESDTSGLVQFYYKHQPYFSQNRDIDQDIERKRIWMLSSIVVAAIKESNPEIVKRKRFSTIRAFENHSKEYNHNLVTDPNYNRLVFEVALDLFNGKRHFQAARLFRRGIQNGHSTTELEDFNKLSRNRFLLRFGRTLGIIGILILVAKYATRPLSGTSLFDVTFLGYLGGLLVLIFGIIETIVKVPSR